MAGGNVKLGFIGAGKMGGAILTAILEGKLVAKTHVVVCEATKDIATKTKKHFGCEVTLDPMYVVANCDTIFLAVKPQDLDAILQKIAPALTEKQVVVSIAAGKKIKGIRKIIGKKPSLVRVMPNLPVLVKSGMVVYSPDAATPDADVRRVSKFLSSCGSAIELPESNMDAVTALSGSGPAFFAYFMTLMANAGVALGLPPDAARLLANKTMLGTAKYLEKTRQDPAEFIKSVCSPKGTTEAGMKKLSAKSLANIVSATLTAAAKRSQELSNA